jgi:NAD(P)-dependent dehydrogenase (short-subunit alcohol dehydrogenase family)
MGSDIKVGKPSAIVTGANRGIGFETCRRLAMIGMRVFLACRDSVKGEAAAETLRKEKATTGGSLDVSFVKWDAEDPTSTSKLVADVTGLTSRIDVLVNNAGVMLDKPAKAGGVASALDCSPELFQRTLQINTLAPFVLIQHVLPHMLRQGHGRIVNVSSGMGQLLEMAGGWPAYRMSKTGLNAATRIFAAELSHLGPSAQDVLVNSCCPGWVKTDMGGPSATRTVEQGADTIVWLATLPTGGPSGGFFRDRRPLAW